MPPWLGGPPPSAIRVLYTVPVDVTELLWDEANEAHIARHRVSRQEVIEVVFGASTVFAVDDS